MMDEQRPIGPGRPNLAGLDYDPTT